MNIRDALSRALNHLAQARDALRNEQIESIDLLRTQIEMALDQGRRLLRDLDAGRGI
ncbi:MAG TPA: hypothetical protein VN444_04260 [Verrucomicrobiae bacterium]|nr:hypothetical protein [Verrucomicrobiae bacterium]